MIIMKVSVVTVSFNEEMTIRSTLDSVLCQTSTDYEYLVCDGKSTDKTVEIAESYRQKFEEKGIAYKVYSEKDGGVYYGMNNAIDRVHGDYVIFINAGDQFYDRNVIKNINDMIKDDRPEVIYGNCQVVDNCAGYIRYAEHQMLPQGMSMCHPSILVRSDIIKENKFDTSYGISADYNMMLALYMQKCRFQKLDLIISNFYANGISSLQIVKSTKEACNIRSKHGIAVDEKKEIFNAQKIQILNRIKNSIPKKIWKIWTVKIKKREWIDD